ncbi:hypothetical protein ACFQRC_09085 [Enterovirga sp. GCM10030262]|uniref:hypothetical protein n=1 Tax=Enterovirga sp. GCM10030262 TaxID=3273391 RepID=UPI00360E35FB
MAKMNWNDPYRETDPGRVIEVGELRRPVGEVVTEAVRRQRAAERAHDDAELLARSEQIRQRQIAKKKQWLAEGKLK